MNNTDLFGMDLWLREKKLERYAQEIKAYCESQNGDCENCYFGKPPKEDETYPSWDCKFYTDTPEGWEVDG